MAGTKLDNRQVVNRSALSMIGSAANDTLDTIFPKIDAELAKLFEDRNITLIDGGIITFPAAGTSVTFTTNLKLHINSQVAGGSPTVIDLAATTRTLSANLKMIYAVINRSAGTATVTDDSSTLPAQTSANQEVVLIAKRVDSGDGTKRVYFRGGFSLSAGQSSRFGTSGILFSNEFAVVDTTDTTKKVLTQVSGSATGTQTTLAFAQTANRVLTFPDITDTLVSRTNTETLSNKQIQYSSSTDSTTTGGNATAQSFTTGIIRLTNSSLTSLSGIPAGSSGQFVIVENKTGNQITINNEEATATASNRIQTGTNSNISMPNNATFMFTYDSTSSRWQLSGGSGSGSGSGGNKNYLSAITTSRSTTPNTGNGNFELGSTTGWSLFNTTLTSGKPTGSITAGAASVTTFNTVSSNQLAGSYSLQTASSGAWSAGQGFISNAFYTDNEDETAVLSFKFYYQVIAGLANLNLSGTSSNTFAVYLYDVTNSAWLEPSGTYSMVQGSGVGLAVGTFQGVKNTTQYRLAVICINASAGATTLYWDDFSVGPDQISRGAAITDWVSFTPTGSWTTNSTYTGRYRRIGDSMHMQAKVLLSGAPNAVQLFFNPPSGFSIDSGKTFGNFDAVGNSTMQDSGVASYMGGVQLLGNTIYPYTSANPSSGVTTTAPFTFGTNDAVTIDVVIPITGWSSSVQMSDQTDTRVVAFDANLQNPVGTINTSFNNARFTSITKDTHGAYSTITGLYTVPVSGWYTVTGSLEINHASIAAGQGIAIGIYQNGSGVGGFSRTFAGSSGDTALNVTGSHTVYCNAGDTLEIRSYSNGTTPSFTAVLAGSSLTIYRLSGPATIAANETVYATYTQTAGQSVTSVETTCNFANKVKDSHNAVTTGSGWVFTAPVSGYYSMESILTLSVADTLSDFWSSLYWNGSQVQRDYHYIPGVTSLSKSRLGYSDYLLAGQTIQVKIRAGATRALSTNAFENTISIKKIGL